MECRLTWSPWSCGAPKGSQQCEAREAAAYRLDSPRQHTAVIVYAYKPALRQLQLKQSSSSETRHDLYIRAGAVRLRM